MFCNKCGANLPDGSKFCSKCGTTLNGGVSLNKTPPAVAAPQPGSVAPRPSYAAAPLNSMSCRQCGNPLTTKWLRCPYCDAANPFYIKPEEPKPAPPPQVIIKESSEPKVVIHQTVSQPEESGCGAFIGKIITGIIVLSIIGSILSQCGAG